MSLQKNQIIPLRITSMSHAGEGIGRSACGMAVFVPMSAEGDILSVRIVKVLSNRAYGIIDAIESPSPQRIENDCPAYRTCGGCSLRHISHEAEMRIKESFVRENIRRIGKAEITLEPPIDCARYARYRNKAAYPVRNVSGRAVSGLFAPRSHRLAEVRDCLLQPAFFADITACICNFCNELGIAAYDEEKHMGILRHIVIRYAERTGQVMVSAVINANKLPHSDVLLQRLRAVCPNLTTFLLDHNTRRTNVIGGQKQTVLFGDGFIADEICGIKVELSAGSFYQVNRDVAELLYRQALDYAAPAKDDILLDLYCGTGTIGLSMAHAVREVIGVEISQQAVRDAKRNAQRNKIENARFLCADAGEAAKTLAGEGVRPDIVIMDPPRAGADEAARAAICEMNPGRIVYISCNPATLARDIAYLGERGYRPIRGRTANLFARTSHVESVILLSK